MIKQLEGKYIPMSDQPSTRILRSIHSLLMAVVILSIYEFSPS